MIYLKGSAVCPWVGGCLLALLAGCSVGESKFLAGNLGGVNHTSAAINHFSVNGYGGPNISPHGNRGGMCCAMLPRQWQPGLKLKVAWETDPNPNAHLPALGTDAYRAAYAKHKANYQQHSAIVDLPAYEIEKLCSLKVHFLPCNQIKVTTACMAYGQPGYPIKEPLEMKEPAVCPK
ncbi:DUF3304 domain-containing protein [Pseudomonas sp. M47T1]|uniref:DUF3304 domain-containing protein n=1 Tax=Pseudomonas sp. M47T1 TaxID=1179778 RepID=UPI001EE65AAF|nr:DUF3304 domain-containing protein [Pseudomonas sp. M47T1]